MMKRFIIFNLVGGFGNGPHDIYAHTEQSRNEITYVKFLGKPKLISHQTVCPLEIYLWIDKKRFFL